MGGKNCRQMKNGEAAGSTDCCRIVERCWEGWSEDSYRSQRCNNMSAGSWVIGCVMRV